MTRPLLEVSDLVTEFPTERGIVHAVRGVSFTVNAGETMALVGESGSGKSVTAMSLMRMVRPPGRIAGGEIRFNGTDLLSLPESGMRTVRGAGISMIFQDPMTSLNPTMRIRDQLTETMLAHGRFTPSQAHQRAIDLMTMVGVPSPEARLNDYPHSYSGGMRQRAMIAMAIANKPDLIIADEPTTALDVTIQAQVLDLLATLNKELGTAIILITHNLGVVARLCQRAAVMYAGRIVEQAPVDELFSRPRHPYTQALLAATPRLSVSRDVPLVPIEGRPPDVHSDQKGCAFADRCGYATAECRTDRPPVSEAGPRSWACWRTADGSELPAEAGPPKGQVALSLPAPRQGAAPLLEVQDVSRVFETGPRSIFRSDPPRLRAVDGVSLVVHQRETVGLVGESGCGKSTLGKVVLGIHPATTGRLSYAGTDVTHPSRRDLREYRRKVQIVFQDPYSSLDPRMTVGATLREPLTVHGLARGEAAEARIRELLGMVGLDPDVASRYPHEFSGGQRQRIAIARALAMEPELIVCDEAVSALDVSLQAQIINLLEDLRARLGLAYLFIGHDIATVRHISDRIAVMYLGEIVEIGPSDGVTSAPQHPYTASLLSAVPEPDPVTERRRTRIVLRGDVPSPLDPPSGCRFRTRCPIGPAVHPERTICAEQRPVLTPSASGHFAACHFAGELLGPQEDRSTATGPVTEPTAKGLIA